MTDEETPAQKLERWRSVGIQTGVKPDAASTGVQFLEREDNGEIAGWVEDHDDHTETHLTPTTSSMDIEARQPSMGDDE